MKNWKVLITICVLGCTRICAQETGANDTVSRHPLTHGVGIDFRPVYLIPTNEFFAGENAAWQPLRKSVSAHLKYSFRFHPDSRYGKLYPHTYQGIGVSYHSFFDKAEIGTPVAVYAFQGARITRLSSRLSLDYEWNFGASFGWKKYHPGTNAYNYVVGSKINAYINLGFLLNWQLAAGWQLTTGIDEFDRHLGGLFRGELLVLAGRPSMGKTALALHTALAVARKGKRVCFFSLEMTERQLVSRLLCMLSGVEPDKLRFKQLEATDREKLERAAEELERLPLFMNYCSGCTFEEIRAKTMALHRRTPLDLIIVDYLNLIQVNPAGRGEVRDTMDLALGDVCRKLKNLIMEANVAGIVLAQLNRNCESRTDHVPVMSDLRNSGEIEQIADSIAFVYRPEQYREYYDKQTKEDMRGVGQLFVAKNRNGATGEVRFRYNNSLTQILPYKRNA